MCNTVHFISAVVNSPPLESILVECKYKRGNVTTDVVNNPSRSPTYVSSTIEMQIQLGEDTLHLLL